MIISLLFFPAYCRLCTFQFSSVTQLCPTLCDPMYRTMPGLTVHHQLMSIESMMASNPLILCHSLLLLSSIFPRIRVVSKELGLCIRWPKYWNFSFSISPSNEHPELISFRMDWLISLLSRNSYESSQAPQFKSINSSVLSFLYSPTLASIHDHWKNHSLD